VLEQIGAHEIIFCLDPSPDATEAVIEAHIKRNSAIGMLVMSRRFGQPAAVMAGLRQARGEYAVVIDVDLQDQPELIDTLYQKAVQENFEVVYAKRRSREGETAVKRAVSVFGYWLINNLSGINIPKNTGDFRIMSRRVIDELCSLKEGHGFLRGLVAFVGFKQAEVEYDRDARHSGSGHYNRYLGSLKIGFNGLVGFSNKPLSLVLLLGFAIAFFSALLGLWMVFSKFVVGTEYPTGIPTLTILVLFMGGVQLACVGIVGEYIGRIYDEVRGRPMYIIERKVNI
jgi:dolichol-phosphate mannosyltransferase